MAVREGAGISRFGSGNDDRGMGPLRLRHRLSQSNLLKTSRNLWSTYIEEACNDPQTPRQHIGGQLNEHDDIHQGSS